MRARRAINTGYYLPGVAQRLDRLRQQPMLRTIHDGSVTSLFEVVIAGQRLGDSAFGHLRVPAVHVPRPARVRTMMPHPVKPPVLRVHPGLADANLDGPVARPTTRRPIAIRLAGIVATLGLALIPTVGFVCGLKLYTNISP